MASKNNPRNRDRQVLQIFCPTCNLDMKLVKRVPGGMVYKCSGNDAHVFPAIKGGYKNFKYEWVGK